MITLEELPNGKTALIMNIAAGFGLRSRLSCMNIREGKLIKKLTSQPLRGPIVLEIDNRQCAIGRGMARRVLVQEK